jgi:hypothetical protein
MARYSKGFSDRGTVALMGSGAHALISDSDSILIVVEADRTRRNVYQFWLRIHLYYLTSPAIPVKGWPVKASRGRLSMPPLVFMDIVRESVVMSWLILTSRILSR